MGLQEWSAPAHAAGAQRNGDMPVLCCCCQAPLFWLYRQYRGHMDREGHQPAGASASHLLQYLSCMISNCVTLYQQHCGHMDKGWRHPTGASPSMLA